LQNLTDSIGKGETMLKKLALMGLLISCPVIMAADIPVVHCPAQPPNIHTLELVEQWRLDGDDEDATLFGLITDVITAPATNDLYMLDRQMSQVLVFSPDGELLETLGREGEGPGEFNNPSTLLLCDNGDIAVRMGWPAKLVMLKPDGTPAGEWSPGNNLVLGQIQEVPGGWLAFTQANDFTNYNGKSYTSKMAIARFDAEGTSLKEYRTGERTNITDPQTHDERHPFFPSPWCASVDDHILISSARDEFRIEVLDLEGQAVRIIERDFAPYRRTEEDKAEMRDGQRMYMNGVRQEIVYHLLDTEPAIRWITGLDDGRFAVGTCYSRRELPEGVVIRYDLHAPDGALLEEVRITGDCDLEHDRILLLHDGRAVVLRNFHSASRSSMNMVEEGDLSRDDDTFSVIVCDLVER